MPPLPADQRKLLEKAIIAARETAETGARDALAALAVDRHEPHGSMTPEQRILRNRLRAHGRQLGDVRDKQRGTQTITRLLREVAYEHWHRMLFARFLAESHLLIHPEAGVPVSLDDVDELARERDVDRWDLAARYAQHMLPQIFRTDDPALAITLPPETRQKLQRLLADLPTTVFTADDSLGWTYQFWQAAEKKAVNDRVKSGEKITGETLPAVTQLFTEHYMVQFPLHNTIGAWHAGKTLTSRDREGVTSEQSLRDAVCLEPIGGYDFEYLRFVREAKEGEDLNAGTGTWRPAAGTYDGWPKTAAELRVLDPCCGSGHFLVAAFDLLVRLRIAEEGLDTEAAIRAVLASNLFGLELDPRCTQIAAFNLAFAAWRLAGKPIDLPALNIACSGIGPQSTKDEWLRMADDAKAWQGIPQHAHHLIRSGLADLHETFSKAPELGSLIAPGDRSTDLITADFETLRPFLDRILAAESADEEAHERAVAASGMAAAAEILAGDYTLVVTNVPYLGRGSQSDLLKDFAETNYKEARADLATMFVARMLRWVGDRRNETRAGAVAAVTPQNWLFLTSYKKFRERLLKERSWEIVARLGPGAFETIGGHVVNVALLGISGGKADKEHIMAGVDVSRASPAVAKAAMLRGDVASEVPTDTTADPSPASVDADADTPPEDIGAAAGSVRLVPQVEQRSNPDCRVLTHRRDNSTPSLSGYADSFLGLGTGDYAHYGRKFWEFAVSSDGWTFQQCSIVSSGHFGGREHVVAWDRTIDRVAGMTPGEREQIHNQDQSGQQAWNRPGVAVALMQSLPVTRFTGQKFEKALAILVPKDEAILPALWCFCFDPSFAMHVREIDQKLIVTNGTLLKVPFDLDHWENVAAKKYPYGLPEPQSDDPTQWLFHGRPELAEAHAALQVGVARLLGYRWPTELDEEMRLAPEARALVNRCTELAEHADEDGIVCLSAVHGEGSAADRLRRLLAASFGAGWGAAKERELLRAAAEHHKDKKPVESLDEWLRERFFGHHCKLFHHRPFVWHIWDGLKDGFNALVNYHRLAAPDGEGRRTLESLAFTYLGEWIERQKVEQSEETPGADARLAAAQDLQGQLEKILAGEPPYDLFVRWKPLHEQPVGWDPDINDGVRLNIRPFLSVTLRQGGKKGAGILRWKPNVKWTKDRGKEPESLRPREQFPWFWGFEEGNPAHEVDFGSGIDGSAKAAVGFDGNRWNELHYTLSAKERARKAAPEEVSSGA